MEQKRITDFVKDDFIEGFFAVRTAEVREYTRGRFLRLELGDNSGRIPGVWWEPDQFGLTELCEGMVVKIRGVVGEYNHKLQLQVNKLRRATDDEWVIEDILPHSSQSKEHRHGRIRALIDTPWRAIFTARSAAVSSLAIADAHAAKLILMRQIVVERCFVQAACTFILLVLLLHLLSGRDETLANLAKELTERLQPGRIGIEVIVIVVPGLVVRTIYVR